MDGDNVVVGESTKTFMNHVFNFDDSSKLEMLNIVQYAVLSILPIVLLNKFTQYYIPGINDTKGSIEIFIEITLQIVTMFIGIMFIHRLITYIPPYSTSPYQDLNVTGIILGFLIIVLSLQTKLGEKVNILTDRFMDVLDGNISLREGMSPQQVTQHQNNAPVAMPTPPLPPMPQQSLPPPIETQPQQPMPPQMDNSGFGPPQMDNSGFGPSHDGGIMAANDGMGSSFSAF
jgi:hypothetical protein